MNEVIYNVRNIYDSIISEAKENKKDAWELYDDLRRKMAYFQISSPQMDKQGRIKQHRLDYDIFKFRRAGETPVIDVAARRGYTAIIFNF